MNKLLIIDDQLGILQMLKRRLTKFGYEVFPVSNHEEATKILDTTEIDLILLDYMMPNMTGFDIFIELRKKYDLPVIMMTAHSSINLAIEFIKNGGVDFIEKPLDLDVLNIRIDRAIINAKAFKRESLAKEKAERALSSANKALLEQTEVLQLKNEELNAFTAVISHDLKAPARNIHNFIGLLKKKLDFPSLGKDIQDYFHFIEKDSKKMTLMISDLLEMAKMEKHNMNIQLIDTNKLVKKIVDSFSNSNDDFQTQFLTDSLPEITGDQGLIEQVFYNLIENAVKYSHLKPNPLVEISASIEDQRIVFAIKDNGIGFEMIYAERLFDMFVRLDTQNQFEGTGIGLANVKKIAEYHQGDVWASSEKNVQTTFYFSIPVQVESEIAGEIKTDNPGKDSVLH